MVLKQDYFQLNFLLIDLAVASELILSPCIQTRVDFTRYFFSTITI